MQIKELTTPSEFRKVFPVVNALYPKMKEDDFVAFVEEMMETHYRLIAMLDDDGNCLGASGFRIGRRLYCGKYIHVDNLVVGSEMRSQGIGEKLLLWVREEGKRQGCDCMLADSYVDNHNAQRFFITQKFYVRGLHLKFDYNKA